MEKLGPVLSPAANRSVVNSPGLHGHPTAPSVQLGVFPSAQSHLKDLLGISFMVTLNAVALLANVAVMVAIVKAPHLRKFAFVCHLCVVDILCAVLLMPLGIVSGSPFFSKVVFTVLECQVYIFLNVFLICASILTITAISIERYYYIIHPMRYEVKMTINLAIAVMIFIWIKSILLALITLFGWPAYGNQSSISAAHCSLHWSHSNLRKVFAIIFSVLCFLVPSIVIVAVYCNVYKVARLAALQHVPMPSWATNPKQRSDSINSQTTIIAARTLAPRLTPERIFGGSKAALTLVLIVGQFVVCWLPYFSFHLHLSLNTSLKSPEDLEEAVTWLAYSSFAMNPFFYGLLNRQIREELAKLRRCYATRPADLGGSSHEGSAQENFLQFLQRTTTDARSICVNSSPRNIVHQEVRIPGQIPEDFD